MNGYQLEQRVSWFDPQLQRPIPGTVTQSAPGCVMVALDDRMVPVTCDPQDSNALQPLAVTS